MSEDHKNPHIVTGGDVVFDSSSAQADLVVPIHAPITESVSSSSDLGNIVNEYITSIAAVRDQTGSSLFGENPRFSDFPEIFPYLQFDDQMNICSRPVPRELYLQLFSREYPELGKLLYETDLGNCIPQGEVELQHSFPNYILNFGLNERKLSVAKMFDEAKKITVHGVNISGVSFVKLLFPENAPILNYLDHRAKSDNRFQEISVGYVENPTERTKYYQHTLPSINVFCDPHELLTFVQGYKCKEVIPIVDAYTELVTELDNLIKVGDLPKLKTAVYRRIKKYHPQLAR